MLIADGDIVKAEAYERKEVVEFWGYVWEYQERMKRKLAGAKSGRAAKEEADKDAN